jgi:hypothetical protein
VDIQRQLIQLLLISSMPFAIAHAEIPQSSKTLSIQDQILQQITSILHLKPGSVLSLELDKKQIVEYSLIGSIALVIIVVIASSARAKSKPSKPKLG